MHRMHGWISRKDRRSVAVNGVVQRSDGSKVNVRLTDISDEGCRLECDGDLVIGEWVEIIVPNAGQVAAQVRWSFGPSAGIKFKGDEDA